MPSRGPRRLSHRQACGVASALRHRRCAFSEAHKRVRLRNADRGEAEDVQALAAHFHLLVGPLGLRAALELADGEAHALLPPTLPTRRVVAVSGIVLVSLQLVHARVALLDVLVALPSPDGSNMLHKSSDSRADCEKRSEDVVAAEPRGDISHAGEALLLPQLQGIIQQDLPVIRHLIHRLQLQKAPVLPAPRAAARDPIQQHETSSLLQLESLKLAIGGTGESADVMRQKRRQGALSAPHMQHLLAARSPVLQLVDLRGPGGADVDSGASVDANAGLQALATQDAATVVQQGDLHAITVACRELPTGAAQELDRILAELRRQRRKV
eukprot:scaffold294_cov281-Pinguiococcus_pyrenoidosus.AAC.4